MSNPDFESGVCKIQNGLSALLTNEEEIACGHLEERQGDANDIILTFTEDVERKKREARRLGYRNCDCILGSVAEVEKLRSIAKTIFTLNRNKTSRS